MISKDHLVGKCNDPEVIVSTVKVITAMFVAAVPPEPATAKAMILLGLTMAKDLAQADNVALLEFCSDAIDTAENFQKAREAEKAERQEKGF